MNKLKKGDFSILPQRFGLLEFRRLVQTASNIKCQEYRNDSGHKNDSPAIGDHCLFSSQKRNQSEDQRAEHIAQRESRLDKAANRSPPFLRSIFNGEGVPHGVFAAEEDPHQQAKTTESDIGPDADLRVGWQEASEKRHQTHASDGEDEEELASNFVRVTSEYAPNRSASPPS